MAYSMTLKLPPEQLEERRRQLNRAGLHAYLSPIAILMAILLYRRVVSPFISRLFDTNPSPAQKRLRLFLRRTAWVLQTTYLPEFGPVYIQLLGLTYAGWLFYLTSRATGMDYMHVTKSFGHVAISQLPFHYLLAVKSPYFNPITWATGLTHERLNAVHRLFGRLVHLWLATHAICYVRFFLFLGVLAKRIRDRDVQLGLLGFWSFNFLALLALPVARRRMYHIVFYQSHVLLSALAVPVLWFHVPYTRWLVGQVAVIYVVGAVTRIGNERKVAGLNFNFVEGSTELIRVGFTVDKNELLAKSLPGQHVYVIGKRMGRLQTRTPFTIAQVHDQERKMKSNKSQVEISLVLRKMGGPGTSFLADLSSDEKTLLAKYKDAMDSIRIEGPYGEASQYMPSFLGSSLPPQGPIILIAGGIGVTYTLPIYQALLSSPVRLKSRIKFIWLVKTAAEVRWVLKLLLAPLKTSKIETLDAEVYITRPTGPGSTSLLNDMASSSSMKSNGLTIHHTGQRPDLKASIDDVFTASSTMSVPQKNDHVKTGDADGEVSMFLCGPSELSRDVRDVVGPWIWREGVKVSWFEEVFGFGGS